MKAMIAAGAVALVVGGGVFAAEADEAKTQVKAMTLVNSVLGKPVAQDRQLAYDEAIKATDPAPRTAFGGEVQPDGSVRYGNVTVTVKNPCPPGHYEPPPLPGRRAKN